MNQEISIAEIICNAFDPDYTADLAMDDLSILMNQATQMEIQGKTDSHRYAELLRIISVQEKLAKAKLDDHSIFYRLGTMRARVYKPH